ncbi:MAG: hypothetical protein M0Z61_12990 [Nitrospiraceae bacterium]|nr:hypothetical protein [Nitrospiraceae bacterium]
MLDMIETQPPAIILPNFAFYPVRFHGAAASAFIAIPFNKSGRRGK